MLGVGMCLIGMGSDLNKTAISVMLQPPADLSCNAELCIM